MFKRNLIALLLTATSLHVMSQVTDRILLGNTESEATHGLITYCPDNSPKGPALNSYLT